MKKRGILLFFTLVLVLIPEAYSIYGDLIYSGTVDDRDSVNITGKAFYFRIDRSGIASIDVDTSGVIVKNGECRTKNGYDICIKNISFSYRNYEQWYDVYKALVEIYQIKSKLEITQTIQNSKLLIDQETSAEISFENTADVIATDVIGTVKLPYNLAVSDFDGCKYTSDTVLFSSDVGPRSTRKCVYKVMGMSSGNFDLKANVTYFDGTAKVSASSNLVSGKVYNDSLSINYQIDKNKIKINENANVSVSIENTNDQYEIFLTTFSITVPEKISVIRKPRDTNANGNTFNWAGFLKPGEVKNFSMEIQGPIVGSYAITTSSTYKEDKFLREAKKELNLGVYCDCPYLFHEFAKSSNNENLILRASIINPISDVFKDLKISYKSSIPGVGDFSRIYGTLNPNDLINIFDEAIKKPDSNSFYTFNITANYESSYGENFYIKDKILIKADSDEQKVEVIKKENSSIKNNSDNKSSSQQQMQKSQPVKEEQQAIGQNKQETQGKNVTESTIGTQEKMPIKAYFVIAFIMILTILLVFIIKVRKNKAV